MKKLICFFKGHNWRLHQSMIISVYKRGDEAENTRSGYRIYECGRCSKHKLHIEGKD